MAFGTIAFINVSMLGAVVYIFFSQLMGNRRLLLKIRKAVTAIEQVTSDTHMLLLAMTNKGRK